MFEFFHFFSKSSFKPLKIGSIIVGSFIFVLSYLVTAGSLNTTFLFLIIPAFLFLFISELYRKSNNPLENVAVSILGILYIAVPFSFINLLIFPEAGDYSPKLLIALFVIIWIYDSFAYLFGITLGKHRLFERISPKKSWEGVIGGTLSVILATYFLAGFAPEINRLNWMIISLVVVVSSTFGDLTESLFKRQFELKDSSSFFPGHGGVLDRFDSLLFAVPVVVFYIKFIL